MANLTLVSNDSYLDSLKAGIKYDTLAALKKSSPFSFLLFPDHIIAKEEEAISHHDEKHSSGSSHKKSGHYHPYSHTSKRASDTGRKSGPHHGNNLATIDKAKEVEARSTNYSQRPAKSSYK